MVEIPHSDVVGIDDLNSAYDVRLKEWRLGQLRDAPGFTFHCLDIGNRDVLHSAVGDQSFEAVVNLAARAGVRQSVEDPWVYQQTNVIGTLNLLELCRKTGIGKFVLASTSSLYGAETPRPFREDANTDRPLSPYAASKKGAEVLCHTYHHLYGIDVTILRYFTVYGPAGRPDMSVFRFIQWIAERRPVVVYGDGAQERDFTFIEDIVHGTVAALRPVGYEVINLGSNYPVAVADAISIIEDLVGERAEIVHRPAHSTDMTATWADISKAERLLAWSPRTSFRAGLARTVAWYHEQQGWARDIATE